jgi:hypothetical protein
MSTHISAGRTFGRDARVTVVATMAVAIVLAAALAPPHAQHEGYHRFADQRAFLGIPNFLDVTSNLAFLVVGIVGLRFVLKGTRSDGAAAFQHPAERWCWGVVFMGAALTCFGSWYYHLAPDSERLAWDRLPMAIGFMGVLAATVSERVNGPLGQRLLFPLVLLGTASVGYWRWSVVHGAENLNYYGAAQYGSLLLVLLMMALLASRYTRGRDILGAVALYALAKAAERADQGIFYVTAGLVSGHTLKHLIAAGAIFWLLRMLQLRRKTNAASP